MKSFLRNFSLRPSCYNCHFKGIERHADITLADFWGIEKVCPEMDDDKGTSLVMTHSPKGRDLFNSIADDICRKLVNVNEAVKYNSSAVASVNMPKNREAFFRGIKSRNFEKMVKRYIDKKANDYFGIHHLPQKALRRILGDGTVKMIKRKIGR